MNKLYSLLGIGLLSAATLSSCKEDAFMEDTNNMQQDGLHAYTTIASIQSFTLAEKDASTRANVQDDGCSFMWNTDDKVTIWNGSNGYEFVSINYNESEPSNYIEFTGDGDFTDASTVWGIYPKKDAPTLENAFTFTLGDATQTGSRPELQNTMHMLAKGTVGGTTITNLDFKHLTALFQFNITNRKAATYKVTHVSVASEAAIFPKTLTVSGEEYAYGEKVKTLTLNLDNLETAKNSTSSGYINFFPMPDMTKDTELTFTLTVVESGNNSATPETIEKKVKIGEVYNEESVVAKDGYKYVAGKRYGVSFLLVADLGYEETAPNEYLIKKEDGLLNLMSEPAIMTNAATVITLNTDLDWQGKEAWAPVADFKGTLDGNGKKISNLTIADNADGVGLVVANGGTIKNLTIENVTVNNAAAQNVGAIAANNSGTIQSCIIRGGTITTNRNAEIGGIAGLSAGGKATINDCKVEGNCTFLVNGGKPNLGGLVGANAAWVKGSSVDKDVSITFNSGESSGAVAGLVGWNKSGAKLVGSYSLATITLKASANAGGLTGGTNGAQITASFAAGSIIAIGGVSNFSAGGLIVSQGTLNGCYSTTTLPASGSNNIGGIAGKNNTPIPVTSECYYTNGNWAASSTVPELAGTTKVSIEELSSKVEALNGNSQVSTSGFEFAVNEGSDKDTVPLIIRKK